MLGWMALAMAVVHPAQAQWGTLQGMYLMPGASVAARFAGEDGAGLLLGGELSLVSHYVNFFWFGGYVDGLYDFAAERARLSVGPELGWSAFGLDAGYVLESAPGRWTHGVSVRPMLTIGLASLYVRGVQQFGTSDRFMELGVLLKYPVELWK